MYKLMTCEIFAKVKLLLYQYLATNVIRGVMLWDKITIHWATSLVDFSIL